MTEKPRTFGNKVEQIRQSPKDLIEAMQMSNGGPGEFTPSERNTLRNEGSTHWEDCWRVHIQCAEKKIIARDEEVAALQAQIDGVRVLAEKITSGPLSHNCDFCHKTDYFQVGRPGIKVENHNEKCSVRIANEIIIALGEPAATPEREQKR
jgi:hypothetical protein